MTFFKIRVSHSHVSCFGRRWVLCPWTNFFKKDEKIPCLHVVGVIHVSDKGWIRELPRSEILIDLAYNQVRLNNTDCKKGTLTCCKVPYGWLFLIKWVHIELPICVCLHCPRKDSRNWLKTASLRKLHHGYRNWTQLSLTLSQMQAAEMCMSVGCASRLALSR